MPNKPSPRIAIKPELYEAIRLRAAKEGMWPHELVSMWIREKLAAESSRQIATDPDSHMPTEPKLPLDGEKMASRETQKGTRPRRGGKVPYEDLHPEIAARVLDLWGGGKHKGGMSRTEIAELLQSEGIPMTAAIVYKIVSRAQQKRNI